MLAAACTRCGTPYPETGLPDLCPRCGGFWGYPDGLPWSPPTAGAGFRRWAGALGLEPGELPERELGDLERGGPRRSLDGVTVVQEGSLPVGTFKERGAEVLTAVCARRGLQEVFLDSSGNAGLAVAAACAARGIACRVLVPGSTPGEKLARLRATGAAVEVVPGDRRTTAEAAGELRRLLPYASHVYQPFFLAGVATLAWELGERLGRPRSPAGGAIERVLLPAGNGSLLLGLALGFDALIAAGRLPRLPALHAVQLTGYASLAPGSPGDRAPGPPLAAGIAVADPPRRAEMAAVLARTGGDVTVVTEDEIARARRQLAARGFTTDPTGAAAWSGLQRRPDLPREGTAVILTSRG
jgi:threonine synthase